MDHGGIFALPNLRGGGEYGKEWHHAGTIHRKQNVFDDFIAAAEYLVDAGITEPGMLGSGGGSNGGLLTAATMLQRPNLFGAVYSSVGVHDMLRYHEFTIGSAWATDYGTSADAEEFKTLIAYSPVHNVRSDVDYPPILLATSDHDDRVVPAHTYKFGAALQAENSKSPVVVRIERNAGHGPGRPTEMVILEAADRMAFLFEHLLKEASATDHSD
jgi:prolyl oligopeptidase